MQRNHEISAGGTMITLLVLCNVIVLEHSFVTDPRWYKLIDVSVPLLLLTIIVFRKKML